MNRKESKLAGRLEYLDEAGYLDVSELIIRESSLAFSGCSYTPEYQGWDISAVLPLAGTTYLSSGLHAFQNGVQSDPCEIRIRLGRSSETEIEVEGKWIEKNFTSRFKGMLSEVA